MLSRKIPKLKLDLKCKGRSDEESITKTGGESRKSIAFSIRNNWFGKYALQGIPVLSIFAFLGIVGNIVNPIGFVGMTDGEAYAVGSTTNATSAALTIDNNARYDTINAQYGATNYASHRISVSANNIENYALTITGPATIATTDDSGNAVSGATTLGGAGNKAPASMADNSWGYAWGAANATESSMTYQSFTGSAQSLIGENVTNNQVNFDRKLAFAAKFAENAKDGHYKATVNLNLTVTPTQVTQIVGIWTKPNGTTKDSGITAMQAMTADICGQAETGDSMYLSDHRDNKIYGVAKLADGNCWMTQNLAFDITQAINPMSAVNSDVVQGWSWPTAPTRYTTGTGWSANDAAVAYITTPTVDNSYAGDGGGYRSDYGYYYSWCAATAGCKDTSGANPGTDVDAASSICPKGWKLPAGTPGKATNDFANMAGLASINIMAGTDYWSSLSNPLFSGYALMVDDSSWLAAGLVSPGSGLRSSGTNGFYWSRTAYGTTGAYRLSFSDARFYPAYNDARRYGYSVRCVAAGAIEYKITYLNGNGLKNGSFPKTQTIITNNTTYTFEPGTASVSDNKYCYGNVTSWIDANGNTYAPADTITLTFDNPSIELTTQAFQISTCY